jgi:hypothetical protein
MATMAAGTHGFDGPHLKQAESIRLLESLFELPLVTEFGEIEQRAGDRGHWNPVDSRSFVAMDPTLMDADSLPAPRAPRRDFDWAQPLWAQTPQRGGAAVA